jgi:beta-glucosidase
MTIGGGSSELKAKLEVSPLQALQEKYGEKVSYSLGYASGPSAYGRAIPSKLNADSLRNEALKIAASADLVLYFGGLNKNHNQDCEGGDRLSYNLPFGQDRLIAEIQKVNPKILVVLISGNAVAMPWVDKVPGIVQAWYLGSEAGNAIASVLSGEVNPSGKLPFTFPKQLSDCGAHSFDKLCYPGDSIKVVYKEDILVGYRWYDTKLIMPQFHFGYGLSYTTFEISKPSTDKPVYSKSETIKMTFAVKNTGKIAGAEVPQIYVTQSNPAVMRPVKELKGFKKVFLKPGETKTVTIPVKVQDMAYWDEKAGNWKVDSGEFILNLATSAGDVKYMGSVQVK